MTEKTAAKTKKRVEKPQAAKGNPKQQPQEDAISRALQFPNMVDARQLAFKYVMGAVIMWMGMLVVTYLQLRGTEHLTPMLQIMGFGAMWSIVIVPVTVFRNRFKNVIPRQQGRQTR